MCWLTRVGKVKFTKTDMGAAHSTVVLQGKMDQKGEVNKNEKDRT